MSSAAAKFGLALYRGVGTLAYLASGPYLSWRARQGKEDPERLPEKRGIASLARPSGPLVWLHAASVGETLAAAKVVEEIVQLGVSLLMTTGTVTSAKIVADRFGNRILHQYAPLDTVPSIKRFLDHWDPQLAITVESEIWPVKLTALDRRHIHHVLINARLSDRSFASWRKRPALAELLIGAFTHVLAQSRIDGERFTTLGARQVTAAGNLKVDAQELPFNEQSLSTLTDQMGSRKVWAAISTHIGEENLMGRLHKVLAKPHPDLLTMIVPRHPERGQLIAKELQELGLNVARRSQGEPITTQTDIYLGDTIGETGLYLRLTKIAFMGRSILAKGGQNPLEAARLDTAVLSGPHIDNFRDAYQNLAEDGAVKIVQDADQLARAVNALLSSPQDQEQMAKQAARTLLRMQGAVKISMDTLSTYLQPLIVAAKLQTKENESG